MTTPLFPVGAKVRRTAGRFAGREGIVVDALVGSTRLVNFPLGVGDHRIARALHVSELELVDAGPFPLPIATAGVVA